MIKEEIFSEKVLLTAKDNCVIGDKPNLTIGKKYPIIKCTSDASQFVIYNDHGEPHWFGTDSYTQWFERLENDVDAPMGNTTAEHTPTP